MSVFAGHRRVVSTVELARIRALPRRVLDKAAAARAAAQLTSELALRDGVALFPSQGITLHEFIKYGGAVASLAVGQGKFLIGELAPVLVARKLGRPVRSVLIAPASLEAKTTHSRRLVSREWQISAPPPRFQTKEFLSRQTNAYWLTEADPDVLLIDELDDLANGDASASKRITRFVREKRARGKAKGLQWPYGLWVLGMTGTLTRNSLMGFWHFFEWSHGPDGMPMPCTRAEAQTWAAALDNGSCKEGFRPDPGPLGATVEKARAWFAARLRETPGVLFWDEDSAASVPLRIRFRVAPEDRELDKAFRKLRNKFQAPGGEYISDNLSRHRIENQVGQGFYKVFDPPPPYEWSEARRAFAELVRTRIAASSRARRPLDTEAQVVAAHPNHDAVKAWLAIKDEYDPEEAGRVRWLSDSVLQWAAEWVLDDSRGARILWCGSVEFAEKLAKLTHLPYYGPKGKDTRSGRGLHVADARKPLIASWHANKRGFDLQPWSTQGIIHPPQSAKFLEQLIGRGHRRGAKKRVTIVFLVTSGLTLDMFEAARSEAGFSKEMTLLAQKILRADVRVPAELPGKKRWIRKRIA